MSFALTTKAICASPVASTKGEQYLISSSGRNLPPPTDSADGDTSANGGTSQRRRLRSLAKGFGDGRRKKEQEAIRAQAHVAATKRGREVEEPIADDGRRAQADSDLQTPRKDIVPEDSRLPKRARTTFPENDLTSKPNGSHAAVVSNTAEQPSNLSKQSRDLRTSKQRVLDSLGRKPTPRQNVTLAQSDSRKSTARGAAVVQPVPIPTPKQAVEDTHAKQRNVERLSNAMRLSNDCPAEETPNTQHQTSSYLPHPQTSTFLTSTGPTFLEPSFNSNSNSPHPNPRRFPTHPSAKCILTPHPNALAPLANITTSIADKWSTALSSATTPRHIGTHAQSLQSHLDDMQSYIDHVFDSCASLEEAASAAMKTASQRTANLEAIATALAQHGRAAAQWSAARAGMD